MEKMISNIVFTKNRPLQLDAYLESLHKYFPSKLIQTYILYKVELFESEYEQLFRNYPGCVVIKENDFYSDFLKILSQIDTKFILFGIDDVVYFDSVDLEVIDESFNAFADDVFGFSLRHSPQNAKACQTVERMFADGQRVYEMNWKAIKEYPFELCATVYRTELVKSIIYSAKNNNPVIKKMFSPGSAFIRVLGQNRLRRKILKFFGYFYTPNTLESWNCRWCQNHSEQLPDFLYFQKQCASAIQVNMVNTSTNNTFNGSAECTVEALADKYKQGYRLDIDSVVSNKPTHTHCGKEYFILTKG